MGNEVFSRRITLAAVAALATVVVLGAGCLGRTGTDGAGGSGAGKGDKGAERIRAQGLKADVSKKSIDLGLVMGGGPPKDGIPAIDEPKFTSIDEAQFAPSSLGILVNSGKVHRFYPYPILAWHEVVNDSIDGKPLAVTF